LVTSIISFQFGEFLAIKETRRAYDNTKSINWQQQQNESHLLLNQYYVREIDGVRPFMGRIAEGAFFDKSIFFPNFAFSNIISIYHL
jgi:hypothetical protein